MCGIAGIHRRTDAPCPRLGRLVDSLLLSIEGRGRDATGMLAMLPNGKVQLQRATLPASRFVRRRKAVRNEARSVLLHTRFATIGDSADERNAHPQINGSCAAIHNGTIYNHRALSDAFGLKRYAEVDSEIIPALVHFAGWELAHQAIDLFDGGAAMAVVSEEHPDELILARTRTYPLVYYVTDELVLWASTEMALRRAWSMTYGGVPRGGTWHELDEWQMLRVNGSLELTAIRTPPTKPLRLSRPVRTPKKRATNQSQLTLAGPEERAQRRENPYPPAHLAPESWMEQAVHDLMLEEGCSYADAFDAVFGVQPYDEDDDWIERSLDEGWWAE